MEISERSFEDAIEQGLLQHGPDATAAAGIARETLSPYGDVPGGYRRRRPEDYDRTLCLLPRDVVDFVLATQPKEWQKLTQHHGTAAVKEQFLARLAAEIAAARRPRRASERYQGLGVRVPPRLFPALERAQRGDEAAPRGQPLRRGPAAPVQRRRTRRASTSLLFLNGIPIFTAELKNPLNGQDVEDAMRQYKTDRDPREPLLPSAAASRTSRSIRTWSTSPPSSPAPRTRFLPFNRGKFGGAGNPPVPPTQQGYSTAYLWEETWARDSVLDLIRQFIHEVEEEDDRAARPASASDLPALPAARLRPPAGCGCTLALGRAAAT